MINFNDTIVTQRWRKYIPITYILWWCKTLYQVEPVVWTSITTGKTWYKVLYQHTMYVISLSNISIKTNFKQITRVEIRLINLYNTLGRLHFVHDVTLFVAVHSFAVLTLLTLTCFPRIPLIWRHDKIVRQRRSRVTSRHSFIITVWWYNILYQTGSLL
jgi:hypothetical protein